jgi:hypothetical protein
MPAVFFFKMPDQTGHHLFNLVVAVAELRQFRLRDVVATLGYPQVGARLAALALGPIQKLRKEPIGAVWKPVRNQRPGCRR